jgi:hypothetical protein
MLLRKKNGLNFTPQDFFDSHVCNLNFQEKSRRVCILTMSIFLIGGLNVRKNGRLFE